MKFELVSIERRVLDPVAPMPVPSNPFRLTGMVATVPQDVPATSSKLLEYQDIALKSVQANMLVGSAALSSPLHARLATLAAQPAIMSALELGTQQPITDEVRQRAVAEVDTQLVKQGLIDKVGGSVTQKTQVELSYEHEVSIPTAGVIVKSCLDDCNICETEQQKKLKLELEHMDLENKLLARQIELLDKSQEYRCCPQPEEPVG